MKELKPIKMAFWKIDLAVFVLLPDFSPYKFSLARLLFLAGFKSILLRKWNCCSQLFKVSLIHLVCNRLKGLYQQKDLVRLPCKMQEEDIVWVGTVLYSPDIYYNN